MKKILVSVLSAKNKEQFICSLKDKDVWLHIDIMDGKFVKPHGLDIELIKLAKDNKIYTDVHLMVEKPIDDLYIDNAIRYGADSILIHYEIEDFNKALMYLLLKKNELRSKKRKLSVGVVLKPETGIEVIEKYANLIDKVLIMSVKPGYGGQDYISSTDEKIDSFKNKYSNLTLEIDGGVNLEVLKRKSMKKVDEFVIGSLITSSDNSDLIIDKIKEELI